VRRGSGAAIATFIVAGAVAIAACSPNAVPTAPPGPTPAPATLPSLSAAPADSSPAASTPSSSAPGAEVDLSLLGVLPAEVEGQALRPDAETAAEIAATEDLARDVDAIAVGLYIAPGTSTADDLAIVNVVRLRPGVFGDAWYRSWRSTYDEGACQVAGGVSPGAVQSEIAEHETHIGTCKGGVHTYHVHLVDPDRVISITAAGEGRFGERVVAGLTE
jgi:hypothetical protein